MSLKKLLYRILPPITIDFFRALRPGRKKIVTKKLDNALWEGDFVNWEAAISQCTGYDAEIILKSVRDALLKVKNGTAVFERDSVIFDKIEYSWPLLACLESIALANSNRLHVIDFGGSLGSTFFQNRHFLSTISSMKWVVVEQKHFATCGKNEFENSVLKFETSIDDALKNNETHCLLLSGVLQYLPDPFEWIDKFCSYNIDYIILDRTGFCLRNRKLLTVQNVPPEIYKANYPCWFFNEEELLRKFNLDYEVSADFNDSWTPPMIINGNQVYWKGFFLKKIKK